MLIFPEMMVRGRLWNQLLWNIWPTFPDIYERSVQLAWVRNPFLLCKNNMKLPIFLQEALLEVCADRGLKLIYENSNLKRFWICLKKEHPDLRKKPLENLSFGITYLCEVFFSAISVIKSKQRNKLSVNLEQSLITAVPSILPRMEKVISEH